MAGNGGRQQQGQLIDQLLSEVKLQWSEFTWSLQKLRHNSYSKKSRESDWFRINPLEMVLLGCQTLANNETARRDHGTLILAMDNITMEMELRPLCWRTVLRVLCTIIKGQDVPTQIIQRCVQGILNCLIGARRLPQHCPALLAWCVVELDLSAVLQWILSHDQHCNISHLRHDLSQLQLELDEVRGKCLHSYQPDSAHNSILALLNSLLSPHFSTNQPGETDKDKDDGSSEMLQIHLYLCQQSSILDVAPTEPFATALTDLITAVERSPRVFHTVCSTLVNIINLMVPQGGLEEQSEEIDKEESSSDEDSEEEAKSLEKPSSSLLVQLLNQFATSVSLLEDKLGPGYDTVLPALFNTVLVTMSRQQTAASQHDATAFLTQCLPLLVAYCTEGYLSDSPTDFLYQLLQFVCSFAEYGIAPMRTIQTVLPNLLGPFFGVRDHTVLCQLLLYGCHAIGSQHVKALLWERGLLYIAEVWRLFPSAEQERERVLAERRHLEAVEVSSEIINILLSTVVNDSVDKEKKLEEDGVLMDEGDIAPLTDEQKKGDRQSRIEVLLRLVELACEMVKNGENICYLYASVLPRLFTSSKTHQTVVFNRNKLKSFFGEDPPPSPGSLTWHTDTKPLAHQLLNLSVLTLTHGMSTPFQLCAIVVPKLIRNIDSVQCSDEQKMSLLMDILKITQDTLEAGHNIEELITHGLDLLSNLLPATTTTDQLRNLINEIVHQLVAPGNSAMLFLIKSACRYMKDSFPDELEQVQDLFRALLHKGRKNEIRGVFRLCRDPFNSSLYSSVRAHLYLFAEGTINARQLLALCELIMSAMSLQRISRHSSSSSQLSEEEKEERARVKEREEMVIVKLIVPCLAVVDSAVKEGRFKRVVWVSSQQQLARIALFRTLFSDDIVSMTDNTTQQLKQIFESKFPIEVLSSDDTMVLLSSCATRMDHMQSPRYDSLRTVLADLLKHYLSTAVKCDSGREEGGVTSLLKEREAMLEEHIMSLPRNKEDHQRLVECGYSERLWTEHHSVTVRTDGTRSLEENMRQTVLACYRELSEILRQLAITHVLVDGAMIKSTQLFDDELSLSDLKGRRAAAVRTIDQRLGKTQDGHFYERKAAILSREDEIETEFDKQARAPVSPKSFTAAINTSFLSCAKCCGSQIVGCYAPTGEHCERPLEIGMRVDSIIVSLYDESGVEIENVEVLLCEEGAYIFKAYTNGHPYDTSQVWVEVFTMLLSSHHPLVPAVVLPRTFPNLRTWELIRRVVQPELTGSMLTCRHDYSPEWRSYYDNRPERVRCGVDIVLHPGFTLTGSSSRPLLMRQQSKMTKDLAGLVFDDVMQNMLQDDWLKQFRFLGKVFSQYISVMVREGRREREIVTSGFDYERWRKTFERHTGKDRKAPPPVSAVTTMTTPTKTAIVDDLVSYIDRQVEEWCCHADIIGMCQTRQKQLLEMKRYLELCGNSVLKPKLRELHKVLVSNSFVVPISRLPAATQEEIIHWVFNNEDRVWRYRGGRDGHETLQQFMNFLNPKSHDQTSHAYPGVAMFFLPADPAQEVDMTRDFRVSNMVGYAVGETVDYTNTTSEDESREEEEEEDGSGAVVERQQSSQLNCYEVVTAWVHPSYRGLNFSMHMYYDIACQAPVRMIMCDMVTGSLDRIINSGRFPLLLWRLGVTRYIIWKQKASYLVTTQTGSKEQFEQIVFVTWPVRVGLWLYRSLSRVTNWLSGYTSSTPRRV